MTQVPKINDSQFQDIVKQAKALVPFYVPEWNITEEKTPDVALLKIFAHIVEAVITRLNMAPDKNFIAFLNMLDIKLIPPQSARAPLTFFLSEGTAENILIPERTQAAAGEITFETEKNILATPSKLAEAYSLNISNDGIFKSPPNIIEGTVVSLLPAHLTYLAKEGEKDLFLDDVSGLEKGDVLKIGEAEYVMISEISGTKVTIAGELPHDLEKGASVVKATVFELFEGRSIQEHILYLGHEDLFNIKPAEDELSYLGLYFKVLPGAQEGLSLEWSYFGEDEETKEEGWIVVPQEQDNTVQEDETVLIEDNTAGIAQSGDIILPIKSEIKETEVNGIKSRWLRCRVKDPVLKKTKLPTLDAISVIPGNSMGPDMAFYNDVPLDLTQPVFPFGKKPRLFDTFYLGSAEAFSKKGLEIALSFSIVLRETDAAYSLPENPTLSWEYWNGKGWVVIEGLGDEAKGFLPPDYATVSPYVTQVTFTCPSDIESTQIGGQENYWIRVRLVGGHYGNEVVYDEYTENWVPMKIDPPKIEGITITYSQKDNQSQKDGLQHCLIYNNLELKDVTEENKTTGKSFKPFCPLDDEHQTLYLGFDRKMESGPISIFFSLEEAKYVEETMPKIAWEYLATNEQASEWVRLEVEDGTRNLTRSGVVEFVVPKDFAASKRFGQELYWIRAVDVKDMFKSLPEIYAQAVAESLPVVEALEPCAPAIEIFHPLLAHPPQVRKYPPNPKVDGVYVNTSWAIQAETVNDEIIGSSNGEAGQTFSLTKTLVLSEEIWVDEINALAEAEMKEILTSGEPEAEEDKDEKGNVTQFWVKWQAMDDLLASSPDARHYEIDRISGSVKFGDGINGAIPPIGTDNIKADYRSGGGKSGNVAASQINALKTSVPFVDKVSNPIAGGGGSDVEMLEEVLERGPQTLRHRNRAVAEADFEWLAKQASPEIARAKCLPNFGDEGGNQPGWVTVIIVPESEEEQPSLSLTLKSQVESYLKDHSANTVVSPEHLQITSPVYVSVGVEATIISTSIDAIPSVENEAIVRLKEFLHPLTGGYEEKGWDFGRAPYLSDFFALLEKIPGVDYVKSLSVRIRAHGEQQAVSEFVMTPERVAGIEMPPYTLVFSGEHKITVTFKEES
jgi:hypothetical protein